VGEAPGADSPKNLSGQTEVFFATDGGVAERPVVLFHHIQKTAGTALRKLIRDNLPPSERSVGRVRRLRDRSEAELRAWYGEWYSELPPERRDAMCGVMAHTANHLLPVLDRPVRALTVVRDPVDRAVSQYYFQKVNQGKPLGRTGNSPPEFYKQPHDSTLDDIYAELGGGSPASSRIAFRHSRFFNGQSRSLLAPHHDTAELAYSEGPPADAEMWRERLFSLLSERYLVGVQERFDDFVTELGERFGWRTFVARAKVNEARPQATELPGETEQAIRAYNWLDDELHRRARERFLARS